MNNHVQTFPYPTVSRSFLTSNVLNGEVAFTNFTIQSVTVKKQTSKLLPLPGGMRSPSPTNLGMVIEEVCKAVNGLVTFSTRIVIYHSIV